MNVHVVSSAHYCPEEDRRQRLYVHLQQDGGNPSQLLELLAIIVDHEDWKALKDDSDRPLTFLGYLSRAFPNGVGWSREEALKVLELRHRYERGKNKDAVVAERLAAMRLKVRDLLNEPLGPQGPPVGSRNAAKDQAVTVPDSSLSDPASSLPLQQTTTPEINVLNPNINSERLHDDASYALRRLKRDAPDLAEKVVRGEMTPHAAACLAGFRKPRLQIPADPTSAGRRLRQLFTTEQREEFLRAFMED